ncbi:unnamed protein product [Ilex paraguariensis]|uniref:Uncharacterized protein n=1 Tax=Ilex paraguariensis TaxID=185542 RepID=A0ABC8S115_9AQUA
MQGLAGFKVRSYVISLALELDLVGGGSAFAILSVQFHCAWQRQRQSTRRRDRLPRSNTICFTNVATATVQVYCTLIQCLLIKAHHARTVLDSISRLIKSSMTNERAYPDIFFQMMHRPSKPLPSSKI